MSFLAKLYMLRAQHDSSKEKSRGSWRNRGGVIEVEVRGLEQIFHSELENSGIDAGGSDLTERWSQLSQAGSRRS